MFEGSINSKLEPAIWSSIEDVGYKSKLQVSVYKAAMLRYSVVAEQHSQKSTHVRGMEQLKAAKMVARPRGLTLFESSYLTVENKPDTN